MNSRLSTLLLKIRLTWKSWIVLIAFSLCMGILSQGSPYQMTHGLDVGEVSPQDIKAPVSLRVEDREATNRRLEIISANIHPVYDHDLEALSALRNRWHDAKPEALVVRQPRLWAEFAQVFKTLIDENPSLLIFRELPQETINLREIQTGKETIISKTGLESQARGLSSVQKEISEKLRQNFRRPKGLSEKDFKTALTKMLDLLTENVSFNAVESQQRQEEALQKVEPLYFEVKKGEMILREGERVEKKHMAMLSSLNQARRYDFRWETSLLFTLLFAFVTLIFYFVGRRNFKKFRLTFRDQWVMGSLLVCSVIILLGIYFLFNSARDSSLLANFLIFAMPLGFTGMMLRLFSSMELTTFGIILQSLTLAWAMESPYFALISLVGSLAGAARMRRISQRLDVFRAGLHSGLVVAVLALLGLALDRLDTPHLSSTTLGIVLVVGFSICSGLLSSGLVLALQPVLEVLGYTTDLKLMELSRTDHPLLKDLILKAPGTYFHSFTVSQLAEKAAEAVHANALFARVASLYHDIGKVKKPHYFIENIKGENRHDKLAPTMSALIIANHVKDGIELAMEYKLPINIIEIIPQHHGTALIGYFFDKAKKQADHIEDVSESDFRYPGPKPQTKEAAIILMADAVEATAKSMGNSSEDQIRQMVHATVQRFFLDGQLDECELSLKDLAAISNAFCEVLQGVYHHRIEYPHLKNPEEGSLSKSKPTA